MFNDSINDKNSDNFLPVKDQEDLYFPSWTRKTKGWPSLQSLRLQKQKESESFIKERKRENKVLDDLSLTRSQRLT